MLLQTNNFHKPRKTITVHILLAGIRVTRESWITKDTPTASQLLSSRGHHWPVNFMGSFLDLLGHWGFPIPGPLGCF